MTIKPKLAYETTDPEPKDIELFLDEVIECADASALMELLDRKPEWLTSRATSSLLRHVESTTGFAALQGKAASLRSFWKALQYAERVKSFDDLSTWASKNHWLLSAEFGRFLQRCDARRAEIDKQFDRFFMAKSEAGRRADKINKILDGTISYASAEAEAILVPSTLEYFAALMRFSVGRAGDETIHKWANALECLETLCYNQKQIRNAEGGSLCLRVRTSGATEVWFRREVPEMVLQPLVTAISRGELSLAAGVQRIQSEMAKVLDDQTSSEPTELPTSTREYILVMSATALCMSAVFVAPDIDQKREAIRIFRSLLWPGAWWSRLTEHQRADFTLRYAKAVFLNLGVLENRESELRQITERLNIAIEVLSTQSQPGLARDLRLTLARAQRELSCWDHAALRQAISTFEEALNIPYARYDCEARGLGLADYASALTALPAGARPGTGMIDMLYDQALAFIPPDRFPSSRATVLLSRAIYLTECTTGISSYNQERALAALDEAAELLGEPADEESDETTPRLRELRASVYLTRGNVLRSRVLGNPEIASSQITLALVDTGVAGLAAAELAYRAGIEALKPHTCPYTLGLLYLNAAQCVVQDPTRTPPRVSRAREYIASAIDLLRGIPVPHAQALITENELWLVDAVFPAERQSARKRIRELAELETLLREFGAPARAAFSAELQARLHLAISPRRPATVSAAVAALRRAAEDFLAAGLLTCASRSFCSLASTLVTWRNISGRSGHSDTLLVEAREALAQASSIIRRRASSDLPLSEEMLCEADLAHVAADSIYLSRQGTPTPIDIDTLTAASYAAFRGAAHLAYQTSHVPALLAERDLLQRSSETSIEEPLAGEVGKLELELARRAEKTASARVSSILSEDCGGFVPAQGEIAIRFAVSEWGTVAILADGATPADEMYYNLPLTRQELLRWLYGETSPGERLGWTAANRNRWIDRLSHSTWERELTRLLLDIEEHIWRPLHDQGVDLAHRRVLVAPGTLAGLPLHAARYGDSPLIAQVAAFAYVAQFKRSTARGGMSKPGQALLVLADPLDSGQNELASAAGEIRDIASILACHDVPTTILASQKGRTGGELFRALEIGLPSNADLREEAPTSRNVARALQRSDLFVFAGHGLGTGLFGGSLALVGENGGTERLELLDVLADGYPQRDGTVILSACETAWDTPDAVAGMMSMTATFLRCGARAVLGSLWWVSDEIAPRVSTRFVEESLGATCVEEVFAGTIQKLILDNVPVQKWASFVLWL